MGDQMTHATKPLTDEATGEVNDPVHHVSYSFRAEGPNMWVFTWMEPGAHLPEHFHPSYEELWEVLDGSVRVKLDGEWRDLRPAHGPVLVRPDVRHVPYNDSDVPTSMRGALRAADLYQSFRDDTVMTSPPPALQRMVALIVARLGR